MGNTCGSDAYNTIVERYGQMFTQMVMAHQAKSYLAKFFDQQRTQIQSSFQNQQKNTFGTMDMEITSFQSQFLQIQRTLSLRIPGGLQNILPNGKPFQEYTEFDDVVRQLISLRSEIKQQGQRIKTQAVSSLTTIQYQFIAKINESQPILRQFQKLPPSLRKNLIERACSNYSNQIMQNNQSIRERVSLAILYNKQIYKNQLIKMKPVQKIVSVKKQFYSTLRTKIQSLNSDNIRQMDIDSLIERGKVEGLGVNNSFNQAHFRVNDGTNLNIRNHPGSGRRDSQSF